MAYYFPEGTNVQYATTFGTAKVVTAATNANPAVLTSAAHGLITGDEILFNSGWEDAKDTIFRVTAIDANSFSIQDLDTTNTSYFPAGAGTGTVQKVTGWLTVPQLLTVSTSGGDPRFTTVSPLAKRNDISIPTGFNATSLTATLAHDPANAIYKAMLGISRTLSPVGLRLVLGGGATAYGYGYLSVSEAPQLNRNQVNQVAAAASLLGRMISYA